MKTTKTILASIIRRTLMEMPLSSELNRTQERSESEFRAAYKITTTLFGEKRFNLFLSKSGGKVLHAILLKTLRERTTVFIPKMLENMKRIISSSQFQNKMVNAANIQIDKIVLENPDLDIGKKIAKTSVGYLIEAIFSTNIAEEAFFALVYRFLPRDESVMFDDTMDLVYNYGSEVQDLLRVSPEEGNVIFGTTDLEYVRSPAAMEGLARKVYDQVTKFYYHHDKYDEPGYEDYGLHFGPGGPDDDDENFSTDWYNVDLKL